MGAGIHSGEHGSGDDIYTALAQESEPATRSYQPSLPNVGTPGKGLNIFREALNLIRQYYVASVSENELFQNAWDNFVFSLLPQCTEEVQTKEDCVEPSEDCLIQAIQAIGENCRLDIDRLFLKALMSVIRGLDPNSTLLDQAMMNELKISTAGKFGGVGIVVTAKNNDYVVISSLDGSPAQKAGLGAGDTILEIDGKPLHGLPLLEVLSMVRGPAGSTMTAVVKSNKTGAIRGVRLKRRVISIAPVKSLILDHSVGYIRIVNFQDNTGREVGKALVKMFSYAPGSLRGLILDLRDNPGGLFEEAIRVAGLFRPSSTITSLRGRNPQVNREFVAPSRNALPEIPTVVLINKGSASASEILAGALRGLPNVLVMGERSFGKASVQVVFPLNHGMALRLTTAHYYTADGRDIDGRGVEPDVAIDSPEGFAMPKIGFPKPSEVSNDPEIRIAVEYLLQGRLPSRSPFSTWY